MTLTIEPPNSVILLVGREEFTPPPSFGGQTCVATADCVAIGVMSVDDSPTSVSISQVVDATNLVRLDEFRLETEGQLSVRDVYNREYETVGVTPGWVRVTIWGDDDIQPSVLALQVGPDEGVDDGGHA